MQDLALSSCTAPVAEEYFKTYNPASRVNTSGISFQKNMHVPSRIRDIMEEFSEVKYIDELAFQIIRAEWFGSLNALQAVRLPLKEP